MLDLSGAANKVRPTCKLAERSRGLGETRRTKLTAKNGKGILRVLHIGLETTVRAFPSNFTISSGTAAGGHQGVCRTGNPLVTCETDREAGPCGTSCRRITEPGNKLSSSHRIPRRTSGARTWVKRFSDDHWYFF